MMYLLVHHDLYHEKEGIIYKAMKRLITSMLTQPIQGLLTTINHSVLSNHLGMHFYYLNMFDNNLT